MILVLFHAPIVRNGGKLVVVAGIFAIFSRFLSWSSQDCSSSLVHHFLRAKQPGCARQRSPVNIENAVSASLRISWMAMATRSQADRGHKSDLSRGRPPEAVPSAEVRAGRDFCGCCRRRFQCCQRVLQIRLSILCFFVTSFIGRIVVGPPRITSPATSKLAVRRGDIIGKIRLRSSHKRGLSQAQFNKEQHNEDCKQDPEETLSFKEPHILSHVGYAHQHNASTGAWARGC